MREHWNEINDLALSRRFADVADREAMNRDFIDKRRMLFAGGLVLLLLSAAATLLLVLNGRRRTRLMHQQHAALDAEHQASRAAREASLAKDAFLGMISHELRTPLHAIVSSIELLGFNYHSEADRKVIRRLETAARHLEAQMKDLTDYARLGAGKLELRHEHFDPRELLASIVDEHAMAAAARGLKLESDASGMSGLVDSDPHRIRQIVNNLVTNAIRYTETGTVRVQLRQRAGGADFRRQRYRAGRAAGADSADLPGVHATGRVAHAPLRRRGNGARDRARAGETVRRHGRRGEHAGRGHHLHRDDPGHVGRTPRGPRASRRTPSPAARGRAC